MDRSTIKWTIAVVAIMIGIFAGIFFFVSWGSVSVSMDDDRLSVNAPMLSRHVDYDNIVSVELRDNVDAGTRTNGFGGMNVSSGSFRNDEFGNYDRACYTSVRTYIVVTPADGRVLVFNQNSIDRTVEIYNELLTRI